MGLGAALLGLVCLIEQRIWAHHGPSPQPSIWATPGSVVSTGSAVTIFCRTPPGATEVRLRHHIPRGMWRDIAAQGETQEVFEFSLQNMMHTDAGIYSCIYIHGSKWTEISDKLQLSVTGVYNDKPSLTVGSGPKGFSERNVTLVCHTKYFFEIFILCRGGNASFPQNCLQQDHNTFLIFPLSPGHKTTYRCFASFQRNSYLWSQPSDPLELSVPAGPSVSSTVLWVTVAAVCFFIVLLLICLCHHWAKCKTSSRETRIQGKSSSPAMDTEDKMKYDELECIQPENGSQLDAQLSPVEDSKEVTYAQLCQDVFLENMDSLPFKPLQGISTQETCVYATLRLSQEESQSGQ